MKQEKKNTGLLIFLVLIILGSVGYIAYEKIIEKSYGGLDCQNKETVNSTNLDILKDLVGTYVGKTTIPPEYGDSECIQTTELTINKDSTATIKIDDSCNGNLKNESGKIAVSHEEIYFIYDVCGYTTSAKTYSDCNKIDTRFYYAYENGKLVVNGLEKQ